MADTSSRAVARARLLIVDDELHIRSALGRALGLMGYTVDQAASGQEAVRLLQRNHYDLMVVDLHMPGMGGLELIDHARRIAPAVLIIVLTGHASLESAIEAVRLQRVVDYLLKPVTVHDVSAAIARALGKHVERVRRDRLLDVIRQAVDDFREEPIAAATTVAQAYASDQVVRSGCLMLDRRTGQLSMAADQPVHVQLTEGETLLLEALMKQPGRVFSPSSLARALWGRDVSENEAESAVRSTISRLRCKLRSSAAFPSNLIETVRGRGYRYILRDQ